MKSAAEVHPAGTVVLSRTASVGFSCVLGRDMATSQDFATWTCGPQLLPRFLLYALRGQPEEIERRKTGSTHKTIYMPDIETLRVPLPPLSEQSAIVAFLDRKTAQIDSLIAAKRRMIGLLNERWQGVVDATVCGAGRRVRLRHVISRITSGPRGWAEYVAPDGQLFVRIANLSKQDIELDMRSVVYVQPPPGPERDRTMVRSGDVLLSITADIGSAGVARAEHAGAAVSQHVALMTPARCSGDWLAMCLSSTDVRAQLDAARYGGTKTQIGLDDIRNVAIQVVDPTIEQHLLNDVRTRVGALKASQEKLRAQVQLLQSRRQSLVTAAVTGQLDVPVVA
jgi:type I restriction enzyme S subunit